MESPDNFLALTEAVENSLAEERRGIQGRIQNANNRLQSAGDKVQGKVQERFQDSVDIIKHQRPSNAYSASDEIPYEQRTVIQKVASATYGVVSPPNVVTAAGHGLTLSGIHDCHNDNYISGFRKILIGRTADLADGWLAHKLTVSSAFGAGLDSGGDALTGALLAAVLASKGLISAKEAGVYTSQRAETIHENYLIREAGGEPNPSKRGKYAMTLLSLRLGTIVMAESSKQKGHNIRSLGIKAVSKAVGAGARKTGKKSVQDYRTMRIELQQKNLELESSQ